MGTQVITRDSGRRLGVVGEVIVDIDRREVVAVGLRDNPLTRFLPGVFRARIWIGPRFTKDQSAIKRRSLPCQWF